MTRPLTGPRGTRRDERGFTLLEMLVAVIIMLVVTGAIFALVDPSRGTFRAQPEVSDMQQRMRVGVDMLSKDLVMAGAGVYMGPGGGSLLNYFAPVLPFRMGELYPAEPLQRYFPTGSRSPTSRTRRRRRRCVTRCRRRRPTSSRTTSRTAAPGACSSPAGRVAVERHAVRLLRGRPRGHLRRHRLVRLLHDHATAGRPQLEQPRHPDAAPPPGLVEALLCRRRTSQSELRRPGSQPANREGRDPHVLLVWAGQHRARLPGGGPTS